MKRLGELVHVERSSFYACKVAAPRVRCGPYPMPSSRRVPPGDIDVVLIDLQFGTGLSGSAATREITRCRGAPRIIILTTYDTEADIIAAVEAGASGYLLKDAPPEQLVAAVRAAAGGQPALAPAIAGRLIERIRVPTQALSTRETEVLTLVAAGLSDQQIAAQLFVSQATIKSHLVHIFAKLEVDSRTAAVAVAVQRGLIRQN